MIQRIQTIFLLLTAIALGLFLWFPVIEVTTATYHGVNKGWEMGTRADLSWTHFLKGVYILFINAILAGTAIGITLINIFLFKNRKLQILLCWFAILFIASSAGLIFYKYYTMQSFYDDFLHKIIECDVYLTWWNVAPLAAILFELLALIAIRKDEELIKSLDRLR